MSGERVGSEREESGKADFLDEQIAWRSARNPHYPELLQAALRRREEQSRRQKGLPE